MLHGENRTTQQATTEGLKTSRGEANLADAAADESAPRDQSYLSSIAEQTKNLFSYGDDTQEHGEHAAAAESSGAQHLAQRDEQLKDIRTVDPKHTNSKYANYTYKSMVDPVITNKDVELSERRVKELSRQKRDPLAKEGKGYKDKEVKHSSAEYTANPSGGAYSGYTAEGSDGGSSGSGGNGLLSKLGFGHKKSRSEDTNQAVGAGSQSATDKTYNIPGDNQYQTYFEEVPDQQGVQREGGANTTSAAAAAASGSAGRNVNIKPRTQEYNDGSNYTGANTQRNASAARATAAGAATGAPTSATTGNQAGSDFAGSRNAYSGDDGYIKQETSHSKGAPQHGVRNQGVTDDFAQSKGYGAGADEGYVERSARTGRDSYGNTSKDSYGARDSYKTGDPAYSSIQHQGQYQERGNVVHDDEYYANQGRGYEGQNYNKNYDDGELHNDSTEGGSGENQGVWSSITNYLGMGGNSEGQEEGNYETRGYSKDGTENYGYEDEMPGGLNLQSKGASAGRSSQGYNTTSGTGLSGVGAREAGFEPSLAAPSGALPQENRERVKQHHLKGQHDAATQAQQYRGEARDESDLYDSTGAGAYSSSGVPSRSTKGTTAGVVTGAGTGAGLSTVGKRTAKKDVTSGSAADSTPYRMVQNPKNEQYLKSKNSESLKVNKNVGDVTGYSGDQLHQGGAAYSNRGAQQFGQSKASNLKSNSASQAYSNDSSNLAYTNDVSGGKKNLESQRFAGKNQLSGTDPTLASAPIDSRVTGKTGGLSSSSHPGKNDGYYAGTKTKDDQFRSDITSGSNPVGGSHYADDGYQRKAQQELPSSNANTFSNKAPVAAGTVAQSGLSSGTNPGVGYSGVDDTTRGTNASGINSNQAYGNLNSNTTYATQPNTGLNSQEFDSSRGGKYSGVGGSGVQDYNEDVGDYGNSALGSNEKGGQFVRDKHGKYDYQTKGAGDKNVINETPLSDDAEQGKQKKSESQGLSKIKNLFTGKDKKGKKEAEKKEINEHGTVFGGSKSGQHHTEGSNFSANRNAGFESDANYSGGVGGSGNRANISDANYTGTPANKAYSSDVNYSSGTGGRTQASDVNYTSGTGGRVYAPESNYVSGTGGRTYSKDANYASGGASRTHASDAAYSGNTTTGGNKAYVTDPSYASGTGNKAYTSDANYSSGTTSGKAHPSASNYASGAGVKPHSSGGNYVSGDRTHASGTHHIGSGNKTHVSDQDYSLSASNKAFKDAEYSNTAGARGKNAEYVGGASGGTYASTHNSSGNHATNAHHGQQYDESLPNYEEAGQHRRKKSLIDSIKDAF